jgi:hypothetical protein
MTFCTRAVRVRRQCVLLVSLSKLASEKESSFHLHFVANAVIISNTDVADGEISLMLSERALDALRSFNSLYEVDATADERQTVAPQDLYEQPMTAEFVGKI